MVQPHTCDGRITGLTGGIQSFYLEGTLRAGILINGKINTLSLLKTQDMVEVRATLNSIDYALISIYCLPREDIDQSVRALNEIIRAYDSRNIVVFGDFNANPHSGDGILQTVEAMQTV